MSLLRINKNPSRRDLALFGLLWLVFLTVAGGLAYRRGHATAATAFWIAAAVVPIVGSLVPGGLRVVYLAATYLGMPIGLAVSYALLAVLYYGLLTPAGWIMRRFGHDPLGRGFDRRAESYWTPRTAARDVARYFRQF